MTDEARRARGDRGGVMGEDNPYACKKCGKHKGGGMAVPREKLCSCEPCPGCAERDARIAELEAQLRARSATATQRLDRIAELEKRPTHESVVKWLEEKAAIALGDRGFFLAVIARSYSREFMEPPDAD